MPTTCSIDFENNPQKVVHAGQLLRGIIKLTLTEEEQIRGAYIRIYGKAYCQWIKGAGKNRRSFTGREDYLDETTYFIGGRDGEIRLAPGEHRYNFQCNLPSYLPTSVEGGIGYIRYAVSVVFDSPIGTDKEFKERFTVLRPLDLNADHMLRTPISANETSTFCLGGLLCCFLSGAIEISVNVPVGGYTPGQTINLEIHVRNSSNLTISDLNVRLVKKIDFYAEPEAFSCSGAVNEQAVKRLIVAKETQGCSENSNEIIRANLDIPPIPPTDSTSSSVVKVTYYLQISATLGLCHKNPVLRIPITIGTRPIQDSSSGSIPQTPSSPTLSLPPAYPMDEEPPTYAEATTMTDSNGIFFRPKYPMFKRTTSYSNGH